MLGRSRNTIQAPCGARRFAARLLAIAAIHFAPSFAQAIDGPYLAMGLRVGEVTQRSAIVWTRTTMLSEPNWKGARPEPPFSPTRVMVKNADIPADEYEGSVPGAAGEVRLTWATNEQLNDAQHGDWVAVAAERDFTHQFSVQDLQPATRYWLRVDARRSGGAEVSATANGSFSTPVNAETWQDVRFTVTTCQQYYERDDERGFKLYPAMGRLHPHFFVALGDNVYYDRDNPRASSVPLCRLHWNRMYGLPLIVDFCRGVPGYWLKDDHDTFFDDCWREYEAPWIAPLTYDEGVGVYREQVPIGEQFYRTVRWGSGLQLWFVETRDFRSANTDPDGPEKTIWGRPQKEWLMRSLLESDADFKILVTPTAIVGPDNPNQQDNHADVTFAHEGNEFRRWTRDQKLTNLYVCNGDRHWQYASVDPDTGLREFSCGPASDVHAFTGPGRDERYHRFYRSLGGFLSVDVTRELETPTITFRMHDVDGGELNTYSDDGKPH